MTRKGQVGRLIPRCEHKDRSVKAYGLCLECYIKSDERKLVQRNCRWKTYYGITEEIFLDILEEQGGGCAICGKTEEENGRRLGIDHCHLTSKFRGLLCHGCNIGLGSFKDSPDLLRKAILYLKKAAQT